MALNKVTQNNRNAVCNTPDNAHIARGGDVNPIVDAMNDLLTAGAVTQATSVTTGVTLNSKSGVVTTVALTTAAGASAGPFKITNSTVTAGSAVLISTEYAKDKTGFPVAIVEAVTAGSFSVRLKNITTSTEALNDVVKVHFLVVNI